MLAISLGTLIYPWSGRGVGALGAINPFILFPVTIAHRRLHVYEFHPKQQGSRATVVNDNQDLATTHGSLLGSSKRTKYFKQGI